MLKRLIILLAIFLCCFTLFIFHLNKETVFSDKEPSFPAPTESSVSNTVPVTSPLPQTEYPTIPTKPLPYPVGPQILDDGTLFNPIPYYDQLDYTNELYGNGTISSDGCSITCAAMICSYLRGETILPDVLAARFLETYGNMIQRVEQAFYFYDLTFHRTRDWNETVEALRSGKVVLVLENSRSFFTNKEHFIILNGISPDNRFFAIDPFSLNYGKFDLKDGFESGFPEGHILKGFAGSWIVDFYEPRQIGPTQYGNISLAEDEHEKLAQFIWYYGKDDSFEQQQALVELMLNRILSDSYPNNIAENLSGDLFFPSKITFESTHPAEIQYSIIRHALEGPNILPLDVCKFGELKSNQQTPHSISIGRFYFY